MKQAPEQIKERAKHFMARRALVESRRARATFGDERNSEVSELDPEAIGAGIFDK